MDNFHMPETWLARPDEHAAAARLLCEFRDWLGYRQPTDSEMAGLDVNDANPPLCGL
jgi:hypothetical protein